MKRLRTFDTGHNVQLAMHKSLLESHSIPFVTRGEHMMNAAGGVPFTECYLELWVLHDEDFAKANAILEKGLQPVDHPSSSWTCPECGENVEPQFGLCWNCGTARRE